MSKAVNSMTEQSLCALLKTAQHWNELHGLTGMLLYVEGKFINDNGGRFIQVLEGPETEVKNIFEKIKHDGRHQNVIVLSQTKIPRRNFSTWSMGFKTFGDDANKSMSGFFELDEKFLAKKPAGRFNTALNFLKSFYSMHA